MDIIKLINFLRDLENNEIIYSTEQANDDKLGKTNPYAVNRELYLIGDILDELLSRIKALEKEKEKK